MKVGMNQLPEFGTARTETGNHTIDLPPSLDNVHPFTQSVYFIVQNCKKNVSLVEEDHCLFCLVLV